MRCAMRWSRSKWLALASSYTADLPARHSATVAARSRCSVAGRFGRGIMRDCLSRSDVTFACRRLTQEAVCDSSNPPPNLSGKHRQNSCPVRHPVDGRSSSDLPASELNCDRFARYSYIGVDFPFVWFLRMIPQ
ncbi:hypothetical protein B0H65DRAFT_243556 [Neurospora tetraspora]|uniref:Uncharacterized protein n=1 Tax=Neurospora tetraspora TaxID=94610 RepID=A0AAE0JDV5_9PEZI|nr:hypothetical protein B0H65DRAFT_243556 [Neurospora tetraspora]